VGVGLLGEGEGGVGGLRCWGGEEREWGLEGNFSVVVGGEGCGARVGGCGGGGGCVWANRGGGVGGGGGGGCSARTRGKKKKNGNQAGGGSSWHSTQQNELKARRPVATRLGLMLFTWAFSQRCRFAWRKKK